MAGEAYIKFLKKGFHGERLQRLKGDGLRWRWWKLYCLSDHETFPGLVSKGLTPLTETEIIGLIYQSQEFNGAMDKVTLWRREKEALVDSELLRSCTLKDGKEYLWNANFHHYQDKYSRSGAQLGEKFYSSFPKLNEHDKALFVLLLSKFQPQSVELSVFGIPEFLPQFDAFINRKFPLFGGTAVPDGTIKHLTENVTEKVQQFFGKRKTEGQSDTKEFVDWYCKTYQEARKSPYLRGGKDYGLAAEMLKVFSLSELKGLAQRFLKEEDAFVKKAGYTIGVFKTMVNRLVMTKERKPIGVGDFSKYEKEV